MNPANQEYQTIIGADAQLKGELHFDSAAKILGRLEGSIHSKGKVLVSDGATCKASIDARDVVVEGLIEGNVTASERIDLKATGRVIGDVTAAKMTMADGATVDGHIKIVSSAASTAAQRAVSAEMKPAAPAPPSPTTAVHPPSLQPVKR